MTELWNPVRATRSPSYDVNVAQTRSAASSDREQAVRAAPVQVDLVADPRVQERQHHHVARAVERDADVAARHGVDDRVDRRLVVARLLRRAADPGALRARAHAHSDPERNVRARPITSTWSS